MDRKIKVLYTIPNFDKAGSGKVVYDLIKELDRNVFIIEVACRHDNGYFFKEVEKLGIPIHLLETTTNYKPYFTLFSRIKNIAKFLKKNEYDIVHSWDWSSDWTEVLAARIAGVKWLYTKKAMSWGNKHWKIRSFLANFIVTINDEMKQYFPYKKAQQLIPLGIDTDYYSPKKIIKQTENNEVFKIIVVANLVPVKGVEILINAIKGLKDPSIKLTVVGNKDNDYGKSLENLCDTLQLQDQVFFLGKKPDVRRYVVNSDVYVIPTLNEGRKEGMPIALVEAMSMGIAVLGSNISGINYVLKDFPNLLFKAGSVEELQECLKKMKAQSSEDRKQIGNALRRYCVDKFSIDKFVKAHETLYKEILK